MLPFEVLYKENTGQVLDVVVNCSDRRLLVTMLVVVNPSEPGLGEVLEQ